MSWTEVMQQIRRFKGTGDGLILGRDVSCLLPNLLHYSWPGTLGIRGLRGQVRNSYSKGACTDECGAALPDHYGLYIPG